MKDETKEIVKLTAKELFFGFFDSAVSLLSVFDRHKTYRRSINQYFEEREIDHSNFKEKIYYLKKVGLIKTFIAGKETYAELTSKGLEQVVWHNFGQRERPVQWDGRFRLIIFDIPEEKHYLRDIIRCKIEKLGFIQIQKSVYVYPFECKEEINALCYFTGAKEFLKYMIADIIEGEEDIIIKFLDSGVLTKEQLVIKNLRP